ncbi:P-loop containing nucleoside triphosphate hydrolase protein [Catenaria anguillulae PL171]|uniref:DNA repair protein RAD51 homolog 3 n=1 Tax=Catenaria anguillulae PL171 TaxID=765915 RepID=A0A1Y2HZL5_9FUNG|nr:P-loop containing nucleoside triphosphate hydrolase protein [Catenaria anguillulae PL171]
MRGRPLSSFGLPQPVVDALTSNSFLSPSDLLRLSPHTLAAETGLSLHDAANTLAVINSALGVTQAIDLNPRSRSNTPRSSFPSAPPTSSTASSSNSVTPPNNNVPALPPPSHNDHALSAPASFQSCLRTGCDELDALLSISSSPLTGLVPGYVYELSGVPGIGTTSICMQLCARVPLTPQFGGLGSCALYIDTESGLLADRFTDIALAAAQAACHASESPFDFATALLESIIVYRTFTLLDLIAVIDLLPTILRETPSIKLIVVDSLSFPCEGGKLEHGKTILTRLRQLAMEFGLIVVVTSKVHVFHAPKLAAQAKPAPVDGPEVLVKEAELPDHCPIGMDVWSDKAHVVACFFWELDIRFVP